MKNFKKLMVLSGVIIGAGLQAADHCTGSGVSITNNASVQGVEYTLYVNTGDKPKKSKAAIFGLASGYTELAPEKSVCFKKAFERSNFLFVRRARQKGEAKNDAAFTTVYKFDVSSQNMNPADIQSIDIVPGGRNFIRLNVYGTNGSMTNLAPEMVDLNGKKNESME